jgi:hypothetical protein
MAALAGYYGKEARARTGKKERRKRKGGHHGAVEMLQGIASVARMASRRWHSSALRRTHRCLRLKTK